MSVTVIVPTRKRPEYLKTTLESIKKQTAFSQVDRIIVSENSDDNRSEAICKAFPELNITYVQHNPELFSTAHWHWLIDQPDTEFTAMLHDDDWWYPTHLETALAALQDTELSACFSNFIFATNEIGNDALFHHPHIISLFAGKETLPWGHIKLGFAEICAICYLYTPFHASGMVARTTALKYANNNGLKYAKPWYTDRIIYPYLSVVGPVAFIPQVLTGVRMHNQNDAKTFNQAERYSAHIEGSGKINELAACKGVSILNIWKEIREQTPAAAFAEVFKIFHIYFGTNNNQLFLSEDVQAPAPNKLKSVLKKLIG